MHKLEKLILESFGEVLEAKEIRETFRLKDLSPQMRNSLEKRYGKSKWPEKDFLSSDMDTYFMTTDVESKEKGGGVKHKVIKLPSFDSLYFNFSDLVDDVKKMMNNDEIRQDKNARELFDLIKSNFRKVQRYLRTERPDQYELMKMRRSMSETIEELKSSYPAPTLHIAGKKVDDFIKVGNNPEDWKVRFVDGTEEPYLNHLKEILNEKMDMNDPVMLKVRRAKMHSDQMKKLDAYIKSPEGKAASRAQASAERKEVKARALVQKLKIKRAQIEREMENDPEIEPTGGPVADMYGDQLNKIDNAIEKAALVYSKPMDYDTAVGKIREEEEAGLDTAQSVMTNIKTFGDLQRFIKVAKSGILGKKVGGALDAAIGFIPGIGNVKTGIDVIRALAKKQDGKTTNTFLDKMDIDDKASAIVDDKVEANFINYMHKRIEDQDPNKTLPSDFNMNSYFNDFLSSEYEKRTIDGMNKVNEEAGPETVLEDATDQMLSKFPTLKAALIKLQTEDFKEFVDKIDWISPRPTEFRINLTNGQDYILKWTGKGFEAQIMGKRYFIDKINDYQQALDKLAILYKEGPMGEPEEPVEPADTDTGGGGGGDFPGGDDTGGEEEAPADDAGEEGGEEEGGEDLTDEPVDFEEPAEEPEA